MSDGGGRKGATIPTQARKYPDPSTELDIYRLTNPEFTSSLPVYYNRGVTRNSASMIYTSDSPGAQQAFLMNVKSGASTQLTEAEGLEPRSVCLLPGDRAFCYAAGGAIHSVDLATFKERRVYSAPEGVELAPGMSVEPAGTHVVFVERLADKSRVRAAPEKGGAARTLLETTDPISDPVARPFKQQILYHQADRGLWLTSFSGSGVRRLNLAAGRIGPAQWSPDGEYVLYLLRPEDPSKLAEIRQYGPESNTDKLVAKTSQYASFGFNRDTSVFAGASRSLASPVVVIMLRVNGRELTLSEHKASDPEAVAPAFAPDAQRIYFQSDRHGKPAIYMVPVERLVEKVEAGHW